MPDFGNTAVFSQVDASNNTGTMPSWLGTAAPSTLDDAGRALQGAVTREWNWRNYTVTAGGTDNSKTLTYSVAPAAYYNGQVFGFIANTTNTGAVTLNINSLGAKNVQKDVTGTLTNLASGDMVSGMRIEVAYNLAADVFVWVNRGQLDTKSNLAGGNTFTGAQAITGNVTITGAQTVSGNGGFGTTTPTFQFGGGVQIVNAVEAALRVTYSGRTGFDFVQASNGDGFITMRDNCSVFFGNNNTEAGRIDLSQNWTFGTTGLTGASKVTVRSTANETKLFVNGHGLNQGFGAIFRQANDTSVTAVLFQNAAGTGIGSITTTAAATAYNTTSDYRLKENVLPLHGALAKVAQLKPCSYTWKVDGSAGEGFIAHELQDVIPLAVTGEKDAVSHDGSPDYQAVDLSKVVPVLVAAIQELAAEVSNLRARVNAA